MMNGGTDCSSVPAANIGQQPDSTLFILKCTASEELLDFNINAELFLHLTYEALLGTLPCLDLASGKFPVACQRIFVGTLGDKDFIVIY